MGYDKCQAAEAKTAAVEKELAGWKLEAIRLQNVEADLIALHGKAADQNLKIIELMADKEALRRERDTSKRETLSQMKTYEVQVAALTKELTVSRKNCTEAVRLGVLHIKKQHAAEKERDELLFLKDNCVGIEIYREAKEKNAALTERVKELEGWESEAKRLQHIEGESFDLTKRVRELEDRLPRYHNEKQCGVIAGRIEELAAKLAQMQEALDTIAVLTQNEENPRICRIALAALSRLPEVTKQTPEDRREFGSAPESSTKLRDCAPEGKPCRRCGQNFSKHKRRRADEFSLGGYVCPPSPGKDGGRING